MSVGTNAVKDTAKTALKGNWTKVIIVALIPVFTIFICVNIAGLISIPLGQVIAILISLILQFFLTAPVLLGVIRYIWRMMFSADDNPVGVFYLFSSKQLYFKAIKLSFLIVSKCVFWFSILNVPTLLLYVLSKNAVFEFLDMQMPLWTVNLSYVSTFLINASVIVVALITLKYYLAPVLFVADENMEPAEALHMSTVISKKSSVDFVYLIFSFLGWILLSLLVMPLVFTMPYMLTAYCVHVRFAVAEYNRHIKENSNKDFFVFPQNI